MTNATPSTLRILCVHDNNSNAFDMQNELHLLGKKLYENHTIDLVYVNGPLIDSTSVGNSSTTIDANHKYNWWKERDDITCNEYTSEVVCEEHSSLQSSRSAEMDTQCLQEDENICNSQKSTDSLMQDSQLNLPATLKLGHQTRRYSGLDASLMMLRQIWTSCPFWGILGVGKGAAIASLFVTLLEGEMLSYHAATTMNDSGNESGVVPHLLLPPNLPQVTIFVSGESLVSVDEPLLISNHFNTSSSILHLVDCDVPPEQKLLIRQFPQGSQIERREKHDIKSRQTFSPHDLNVLGRFICQRKKRLFKLVCHDHENQQSTILALQTALYNAEQDAANCIAESIALNPPAALMAVIQPQMVAGWHGNRRPQPAGGGAPCPEEFLHRKKANT